MNLYLLTNNSPSRPAFDYYDSILVAAMTLSDALLMQIDNPVSWNSDHWPTNANYIGFSLIGVADDSIPCGMVIGSFNQS